MRPLLCCAIVFGGIVRIFECYSYTSTKAEFIELWQSTGNGPFAFAAGIKICAVLFLLLATLDLALAKNKRGRWATFIFCIILAVYGWLLNQHTAAYARETARLSNLQLTNS